MGRVAGYPHNHVRDSLTVAGVLPDRVRGPGVRPSFCVA